MPKKKKAVFEVVRGGNYTDPVFTIPYTREEPVLRIENNNIFTIGGKFDPCEFMFQFNDEEPVVFVTTSKNSLNQDLSFKITNGPGGTITFSDIHGKTFRIFAREKTELKKV
jgi:hypothetical protein